MEKTSATIVKIENRKKNMLLVACTWPIVFHVIQ